MPSFERQLKQANLQALLREVYRRESYEQVIDLSEISLDVLKDEVLGRLVSGLAAPLSIRGEDDHVNLGALTGQQLEVWLARHLKLPQVAPERRDAYKEALAQDERCVAVLFDTRRLTKVPGGYVSSTTFKAVYKLDVPFPFADEPVLPGAFTGFVGSERRLVTAKHCIDDPRTLPHLRAWFGFTAARAAGGVLTIPDEELYDLDPEVFVQGEGEEGDWSVLGLMRPVDGSRVPRLRREGEPPSGTRLHMIGHPRGLPRKVVGSGVVRASAGGSTFQAALDAYGGESGAPVFNATTHEIEGIHVRGPGDISGPLLTLCPLGCDADVCVRANAFADRL